MINPELFPDVDIFTQELAYGGKLTIVRGGWGRQDAKRYMDNVVTELMEGKLHNQFVEIHLDIPQVRVVIEGINNFDYTTLDKFLNYSK